MAGLAKTDNFMIGAGTLMLGTQARLFDLLPATDSVGLVKNISISADPTFADLTQGSKNTVVYSMLTGFPVKISAEVFEYTAQNLTYGLSLDGSGVATQTVATTLSAPVDGDPTPAATASLTSLTGLPDGSTVAISIDGTDDNVLVRKIASHASLVVTWDFPIPVDIASGATITKLNTIDVGSQTDSPFLSAKIAGKLANGKPIIALFPKVRITKGFNLAFNSEQYGNLPFEFEVMDLLPTDTNYSSFSTQKGKLFTP